MYSLGSGLGGVLGALIAGTLWKAGDGELAFAVASSVAALALLPAMKRFGGRVSHAET
jgi:PPP family 3-phenylpropionic acid transporter